MFTHAPLQSVPLEQRHAPPAQYCPDGHARPQPPQFAASVFTSTHALAQSTLPAGHDVVTHAPSLHDCPEAHARPQPPQCAASLSVYTHAPAQSVPVVHAHTPDAQYCPATHPRPHVKQPDGESPHSREPQSLSRRGWAHAPSTQMSRVHVSVSSAHAIPLVTGTHRPPEKYWHGGQR